MDTDITVEMAKVSAAMDKPTIGLLTRKHATLALATFRITFQRDRQPIPAERLHTQVDGFLRDLADAGIEVPLNTTGRDLCKAWMDAKWLLRTTSTAPGASATGEEYALTSHSLQALDLTASLARERAQLSESRIQTILSVFSRMASNANPDREERVRRLQAQIDTLTAERDRITAGGELSTATDEQLVEEAVDVLDLVRQLPGDFKRVEEAMTTMHRTILTDFRGDVRSLADILGEYLARAADLGRATAEGRAFQGAFDFLGDDIALQQLRADLELILRHPFAEVLQPAEQRELRGTVRTLTRGLEEVLIQRTRLSATLSSYIRLRSRAPERELDAALTTLEQQLTQWMRDSGPRASVAVQLLPSVPRLGHISERVWDPGNDAAPPPLEDVSDQAPAELNLQDLRSQGGPSFAALREHVAHTLSSPDTVPDTVAEVFSALPEDLHRPVEVLGLLHVLAGDGSDTAAGLLHPATDVLLETTRPDGSRRSFTLAASVGTAPSPGTGPPDPCAFADAGADDATDPSSEGDTA